jgi:ABC-type transport system involved in multi-copper enzyme maturation permease subunit
MSKILTIIALALILLVFLATSAGTLFISGTTDQTYLPPQCSSLHDVQGLPTDTPCLNHAPTQQDLAQAAQKRHSQLELFSSPLRPPLSLVISVQFMEIVGLILLIVIAGTIAGGEYSVGTVRLMYTRGPTRMQFLLAKMGAVLLYTVIGFLVIVALGVATAAVLNLFSGIPIQGTFLQNGGLTHIIMYILGGIVSLFVYVLLAIFLATLGRATVAGVAGAIVWYVLEGLLTTIFGVLSTFVQGPFSDLLKSLPDYLIGNNVSALLQNQATYLLSGSGSTSDLHAWLVLLAYIVLFTGLSLWLTTRRDITN